MLPACHLERAGQERKARGGGKGGQGRGRGGVKNGRQKRWFQPLALQGGALGGGYLR